ncbi:MAG: hypothetical protein KIT24_10885 [Phycisphaeraceae bacterium]|nr:hypothetical protein [Phycisphaeraceae bacterium]
MTFPRSIQTSDAPPAAGHYSQAIVYKGLVFVSAQLPVAPGRPEVVEGGAASQTKQAMANLLAILLEAGSGPAQLLKVTVYMANIAYWDEINAAYANTMGTYKPARAMIPTGGALHLGALVAIDGIAGLPET